MKKQKIDEINKLKEEINKSFKDTELELCDRMRRLVNEVENTLKAQNKAINNLINNDVYNNEYIKALNFLSWFNWDKLYSKTLINEAKNKLIKELNYVQKSCHYTITTLNDIDINKYYTHSTIATTQLNSGLCTVKYDPMSLCVTNSLSTNIDEEPVKPKYEDYVKAVVKAPHNFTKEIVYKVYKYLLEVIEKDKIASKYRVV